MIDSNTPTPKVSIIPVYNMERFVGRCLDSCFVQ